MEIHNFFPIFFLPAIFTAWALPLEQSEALYWADELESDP